MGKAQVEKGLGLENAHGAILHLKNLATALEYNYPDAAASLREGLEETVTILKFAIPGLLRLSLRSTNPIESAFSLTSKNMKNVRNWKNGSMVQRWVCTAVLDAEHRAHRINGIAP